MALGDMVDFVHFVHFVHEEAAYWIVVNFYALVRILFGKGRFFINIIVVANFFRFGIYSYVGGRGTTYIK